MASLLDFGPMHTRLPYVARSQLSTTRYLTTLHPKPSRFSTIDGLLETSCTLMRKEAGKVQSRVGATVRYGVWLSREYE